MDAEEKNPTIGALKNLLLCKFSLAPAAEIIFVSRSFCDFPAKTDSPVFYFHRCVSARPGIDAPKAREMGVVPVEMQSGNQEWKSIHPEMAEIY